ncbi:energy transducer TonB [Candidatus Sodalis pierantonius]|uniref:energy transducer TonB n=1 Tax=Candidatus Sodalis pierantonii TaxID=1486991 RepID=UPI00056F96E8|nr:energy transducer TonB [Candidatus Sodalis pierantonius]
MALTILNQTHRFSWPFIASAGLHASLVAGLLYATVPPMSLPSAVEQPMTVMLVAPEPQQAPPVEQPPDPQPVAPEPEVAPQPVPEPEPEPVPEPPAPVQVPKPVPKPKPKPKPERHREIKPRTPKPETRPASPAPSAPRATFRTDPIYPPRASALGIEGRVSVMYDVDAEGRVENIRIVSAQPRNMFERGIRLAMRRWTYETGKPTANMTVNFQFDIKGVSSGE